MGLDDLLVLDGDDSRKPTQEDWDTEIDLDPFEWRSLGISMHCNRSDLVYKTVYLSSEVDWTLENIALEVDIFYSTPIPSPSDLLPIAWQVPNCPITREVVQLFRDGCEPTWGDMIGSASWYAGFDILAPNLIRLACDT